MIDALVLDLDGTVYVDGEPISNVVDYLNKFVEEKGGKVFFLTNNTSVAKSEYIIKLNKLGFDFVSSANVISPIDAFISSSNELDINTMYALLPAKVVDYIHYNKGPKQDVENPDIVLIGFDTELTYEKTKIASQLINNGVPYYITHIDLACPSKFGPIPDCGSIAKLIEYTTKIKPRDDFGKPSKSLARILKNKIHSHSIDLKKTVLVGDRYYTDIKLGNIMGVLTCHVQTGEKYTLSNKSPKLHYPDFEYYDICKFMDDKIFDKR